MSEIKRVPVDEKYLEKMYNLIEKQDEMIHLKDEIIALLEDQLESANKLITTFNDICKGAIENDKEVKVGL